MLLHLRYIFSAIEEVYFSLSLDSVAAMASLCLGIGDISIFQLFLRLCAIYVFVAMPCAFVAALHSTILGILCHCSKNMKFCHPYFMKIQCSLLFIQPWIIVLEVLVSVLLLEVVKFLLVILFCFSAPS